jgi:hypothetical protein
VNREEEKDLADFCFILDKIRGLLRVWQDRARRRSIEIHAVGGRGEEGEIPSRTGDYLGRDECYSTNVNDKVIFLCAFHILKTIIMKTKIVSQSTTSSNPIRHIIQYIPETISRY